MSPTAMVAEALLWLAAAVGLLALATLGLHALRRLTDRRRARVAAPVRGLLLELVSDDEAAAAIFRRLAELPERSWAVAEPQVITLLGKVDGEARELLVGLLEEHGAGARAIADTGRRGAARRARAAELLGRLGRRDAVPALCGLLADRDRDVRNVAARALGHVGDRSVCESLLAGLAGRRPLLPRVVAGALIALSPGSWPSTADAVRHKDPLVRAIAVEVLGLTGAVPWTARLAEALEGDTSVEVRVRAAKALGRLGGPTCREPLLAAVQLWQPPVLRAVAAGALGGLGDPSATPQLRALLDDPSHRIADAAAEALLQLGSAGRDALRQAASGRPESSTAAHARAALAAAALEGEKELLLRSKARATDLGGTS